MRRARLWSSGLLGVAVVLAACSPERLATPTKTAQDPTTGRASPSCPDTVAVKDLINALFRSSTEGTETSDYQAAINAFKQAVTAADTLHSQSLMLQAVNFALQEYFAGALIGGQSASTQSQLITMLQDMYCQVAMNGSQLSVAGLSAQNFLGVVQPTSGGSTGTTVIAGDHTAGVRVTGTTSPTTVQILNTTPANCGTGTATPSPGPLCTPLDQYPAATHIVSFLPEPAGSPTYFTSECVDNTGLSSGVVSSLHLAHNVLVDPANPSAGQRAEILPYPAAGEAPALSGCGPPVHTASASALPTLFRLARAGDIRGAASQIGSMVASLFVTDAWATGTTTTLSGTHHSGSPFVPVDTTVFIVASSPTSGVSAPFGTTVTPPAVKVQTHGTLTHPTPTPLPGVTVQFSGPPGSTQLTGPGCPGPGGCSTVTTTTNANGAASVGSWTLVVGINTVNAAGTYPQQTGPAPLGAHAVVTVSGNPVVFTATGTGDVIKYGDPGYQTHLGDTVGFGLPSFTIPSNSATWLANQPAAFGSDIPSLTSKGLLTFPQGSPNPNQSGTKQAACPLDSSIKSFWKNSKPPTIFLAQKTFMLPAGYQGNLKVGLAIDNDAQVFVNGVDVTAGGVNGPGATAGTNGGYNGQFLLHNGCAAKDSYFIPVRDSVTNVTNLRAGPNTISVRARNDSTVSHLDLRLSTP